MFDHVVKPDIVAPGNKLISVLSSTSATLYSATNSIPTNYYNTKGTTAASTTYFTSPEALSNNAVPVTPAGIGRANIDGTTPGARGAGP